MRTMRIGVRARLGATALIGATAAALEQPRAATRCDEAQREHERKIAQLQKAADKARQRAQERVRLAAGAREMLGMTPKLWLEALDESHRYGSVLYHYWQRWEASRTRWRFFDWLDRGRGSLIDLPTCPRRLLDEARTLYMTREQLALCEVRIQDGRLVWAVDGDPVTLPLTAEQRKTPRARAISALVEGRLAISRRREQLLHECRAAVVDAIRGNRPPTEAALRTVTAPLVREGLLRQLRDPHFHERAVVLPTVQDEASYRTMWERFKLKGRWTADGALREADGAAGPAYALPAALLDGLRWEHVLTAIDHEEGRGMASGRVQTADERLYEEKPGKGGIFVVDQFGVMFAAQKVPGALHHSSFTGGKCCQFAGSIRVREGRVLMVSPHSGHYVPTQAEYDALLQGWAEVGLDLSSAKVGGFVKEKR